MAYEWSLRPSILSDAHWMAELRARVMRPDLERLGRIDPVRVRQRFVDAFIPENTSVIHVRGEDVGLIAARPEADSAWIEHFYLEPAFQGKGIGGQVLRHVMFMVSKNTDAFRIDVLQGSAARRLYERCGFEFEREDGVDVFLIASANSPDHNRRAIVSR